MPFSISTTGMWRSLRRWGGGRIHADGLQPISLGPCTVRLWVHTVFPRHRWLQDSGPPGRLIKQAQMVGYLAAPHGHFGDFQEPSQTPASDRDCSLTTWWAFFNVYGTSSCLHVHRHYLPAGRRRKVALALNATRRTEAPAHGNHQYLFWKDGQWEVQALLFGIRGPGRIGPASCAVRLTWIFTLALPPPDASSGHWHRRHHFSFAGLEPGTL